MMVLRLTKLRRIAEYPGRFIVAGKMDEFRVLRNEGLKPLRST